MLKAARIPSPLTAANTSSTYTPRWPFLASNILSSGPPASGRTLLDHSWLQQPVKMHVTPPSHALTKLMLWLPTLMTAWCQYSMLLPATSCLVLKRPPPLNPSLKLHTRACTPTYRSTHTHRPSP